MGAILVTVMVCHTMFAALMPGGHPLGLDEVRMSALFMAGPLAAWLSWRLDLVYQVALSVMALYIALVYFTRLGNMPAIGHVALVGAWYAAGALVGPYGGAML